MGSLFFIIKNTILTVVIICCLQFKLGSKTLEHHLLSLIRSQLAPSFIGAENLKIKKIEISENQISEIRKKVYQSKAFKTLKNGAKEALVKEMKSIMDEQTQKLEKAFEEADKPTE